jgi:osmoprotectant transport system ATP-binding protein
VQEAFEMGTTVALMQKGKIMQKGKPVDLLYRPANQYVRSFLSGNYLSLALTETSIEQLWQWLEDTGRNESEYYPTFYSSLTISKVMNGIGDKNKYDGTIKLIRDNSETKYTTWHGLIKAFAAFQKCRNQ